MNTRQRQITYAQVFDQFVRSREIDEDDEFWSEEDHAAWQQELTKLRESGVLRV